MVKKEELRLVLENDEWKVAREPVRTGRENERLVEVGPVDVFHVPAPLGLLDRIEATTVTRASRVRLDPALRDALRWARALPGVAAVESLEPAGERPRVRIGFDAPERSLTLHQTNDLTGADAADAVTLRWQAEETTRSPVYLRGS